jgi:hypothetical protein
MQRRRNNVEPKRNAGGLEGMDAVGRPGGGTVAEAGPWSATQWSGRGGLERWEVAEPADQREAGGCWKLASGLETDVAGAR